MFSIADNLENVRNRIEKAATAAQRDHASVRLLAVSKTRQASELIEAVQHGVHEFGENYLQEALDKITEMNDPSITWHFIGPIQSNKTRPIAEHFQWVHTVDRLKVAQRLSSQRPTGLPPLNICIQINIDNEDSKSGIALSELQPLARQINELPNLHIRGLMAIPRADADNTELQHSYTQLQNALAELKKLCPSADTLSIGMSDDLEVAIHCGATIVRIGTAIFGPRSYGQP